MLDFDELMDVQDVNLLIYIMALKCLAAIAQTGSKEWVCWEKLLINDG